MIWIISTIVFFLLLGFSILNSIPRDNEEEEYKEFKKYINEWNSKHNKKL